MMFKRETHDGLRREGAAEAVTARVPRPGRDALRLGLVVLVLAWIATRFGSGAGAGVAAVWPVDAVIMVTLLRRPRRQWPGLILAAVVGETASALYPLVDWRPQFGLALCDVLEASVGAAALLRFLGPGLDLSKRRDLAVFGLIALGAGIVSAIPASLVFWLAHGASPIETLPNWVLGDSLGLVIVAPALLAVQAGELKALFSAKGRLRTFAVLGCELAIVVGVYSYKEPLLMALILVAMMLPAVELDMTGAAIGVFLSGAAIIALASANPALVNAPLKVIQHDIDVVQVFLAVAAVATLGLAATIADRRRLRALMEQAARQFQVLTENANDMVTAWDLQGRLEYVSPACRDMVGYDPSELIGRSALALVHTEDRPRLAQAFAQVSRSGSGDRVEYRAVCKDGRVIWVEGRPKTRPDPVTGAMVGFMDVVRDVTERRLMEEELERKRDEAEAAAVAKTEFLANMSHEIRTPLTAIIGFAGLIDQMEGLPAPAADYIERIVTAGRTLLLVVNDILDFSKIEAGQLDLDPQPFDPRLFLTETLGLAAGQAERKGLSLTSQIDDNLPAVVLADSSRLRQVLLNLIGNAVKFTDRGGVVVRAAYDAIGPGWLRLSVSDTGAGIAAGKQDRLFQRFSQLDGSTSRIHGGTGLGLVICKALAEMMDGEIGVDSVEGQGSTFWIAIPAPAADLIPAQTDPDRGQPAMPSRRILIVDDLAVNRELISVMLRLFGHDLTEAANGQDAVEAAMRAPFDLILMDLHMPGMDGLAAARAIREASDLNRRTPIVALSANAMAGHVAECLAAGMDDHIAKPIAPATLMSKVAQWTAAEQGAAT